jgi:molecular chaperone DnaK
MTAIGIDLGTSNTAVAHVKDGAPHTLCDAAGRRLIPSIVSFHPSGTVIVGDAAKMRRFNDAPNTVTGAKRLMGRTWGSPELIEMQKRISYPLREGKNRTVRAFLRGELYSIPELSAFVLRKAKAWAEEALGETVTEAVITVPANFNELQRQATKLAGELAGLEVLRVLNEPTAAALAYNHVAPPTSDELIAVYDFGGGTFDLTVLRMSERALRVRATAGDMFLGGDDIDIAIATKMAETYLEHHYYDPRADPEVFARVRVAAERLKIALSTDLEATATLNELMYGQGGKAINWTFRMTRAQIDALLDPFIERSMKVCKEAIGMLKVAPGDFDRVVLVGGTTLSPRVRQRVTDFFGREPVPGVDPEEAVALGAAISGTIPVARKQKAAAQPVAAAPAPAAEAATAEDDYPVSEAYGEAGVVGPDGLFAQTGKAQKARSRWNAATWGWLAWAGVGVAIGLATAGVIGLLRYRQLRREASPPAVEAPPPPAPPAAP